MMRRTFFVVALAVSVTPYVSNNALAQAPAARDDARILTALPDSLVMCEGDTRFPKMEVAWNSAEPAPSDDPPDVRWSSAADSIATVKSNSQVTAHKAGTTRITATILWGTRTATRGFPLKVLKGRSAKRASNTQDVPVCRE
jgi:hypothetical protein